MRDIICAKDIRVFLSVGQIGLPNLMQKRIKVLMEERRFFLVPLAKVLAWVLIASSFSSSNCNLSSKETKWPKSYKDKNKKAEDARMAGLDNTVNTRQRY